MAAALTLNGGSLSFGALSTDTAALTVNSVAGTGATALQIGLSSVTANTEYALLHGTGMTDTSMFTLGGSAAELYKATFTVSDDTLYVSLSDKDSLLNGRAATGTRTPPIPPGTLTALPRLTPMDRPCISPMVRT